jgi:hypothetical protein
MTHPRTSAAIGLLLLQARVIVVIARVEILLCTPSIALVQFHQVLLLSAAAEILEGTDMADLLSLSRPRRNLDMLTETETGIGTEMRHHHCTFQKTAIPTATAIGLLHRISKAPARNPDIINMTVSDRRELMKEQQRALNVNKGLIASVVLGKIESKTCVVNHNKSIAPIIVR